MIWLGLEHAWIYAQIAKEKLEAGYELLKPYNPEDLLPAICGLAMVFFGGSFPMVIATVVAFRETGTWESFSSSVRKLVDEVRKILAKNAEDDKKDDDNDGVADVKQVSSAELAQRKLLLVLKTVDPKELDMTMTTLTAGMLAVLASLKLKFARTLALGASLSHTLEKPATRYLKPILKASLDQQYHKWIKPVIGYACKTVAMSLAFWLQSIISAVHSAVNGGQLFTASLARYLNKNRIITFNPDESNLDEMAGYAIAVFGLYYQMLHGPSGLLSLILLPVTICEWAIKLALSFA